MSPPKRISPDADNAGTETTTNLNRASESTASFEEMAFDRQVVDSVDRSLWSALFNGHYRLALRCDVCGRWLTSSASKRAHRGPRCSAKAGAAK